jgi:hypothetical protein
VKTGPTGLQTLALDADGRTVFSAALDQPVLRRWDVAGGRVVQTYALPQNGASGVAASRGGRRVAAVCRDGSIRLWDAVTGRECWRSETSAKKYRADGEGMAFSPDGAWLAVVNDGGNGARLIDLWDARTGRRAAGLSGHGRQVVRMAFSSWPPGEAGSGRRLASTAMDGTALVWDVEAATGRRTVGVLDPARRDELWADLAADDGLAAHAADAATLLKAKLRPAVAVAADRVGPLVARLAAPSFADREKAQRDLAALGPAAEPSVRAGRDAATVEARRRIDAVLAGWDGDQRRGERAVEALEFLATPDARKLLTDLAAGDPAARLTRAAKSAVGRLAAHSGN